ncbi:hypothetical protein E4T39_08488 [Aureobasidium subglaciale]|nr:hypothetical protein E4T39_08488 [Aureobasidium subglaciale]
MSLTENLVFPVSSLVSIDSVPITGLKSSRRRSKNNDPPSRTLAPLPSTGSSALTATRLATFEGSPVESEDHVVLHLKAISQDESLPSSPIAGTQPSGHLDVSPDPCFKYSIQGFGAVIGFKESVERNLRVLMTSDNSKAILGYSSSELFALDDFADILEDHESEVLLDHAASAYGRPHSSTPDIFDISIQTPSGSTNYFSCAIHADALNPSMLVCEFEPNRVASLTCNCSQTARKTLHRRKSGLTRSQSDPICCHGQTKSSAIDTISTISRVHEKSSTASTNESLLEHLVRSIKDITGHQDVYIHQFDKHWNGRVIAKSDVNQNFDYTPQASGRPSSFNLTQEFRDAFETQKVQVQSGLQHGNARLIGRSVDMPLVDNKSLYLRVLPNLPGHDLDGEEIQSRVMVPLRVSDSLWGVLISHSIVPGQAPISFLSRGLCRLVADSASRRIENLMNSWTLESRGPFAPRLGSGRTPTYDFPGPRDLLSTLKADFAISVINGTKKLMGSARSPQEGLALLEYLQARNLTENVTSVDFAADFPDLHYQPGFKSVTGFLFIPLSPGGEDVVVFFQEDLSDHGNEEWSENDIQNAAMIRVVYWKFNSVWKEKENALQESRLCKLLMSNSSHEFRTLLNAIQNYLEFASDGRLDSRVNEIIERAKDTSHSLLNAVAKLLDCVEKELE